MDMSQTVSTPPPAWTRISNLVVTTGLIALLLAGTAYFRFHRITEEGLSQGDSIGYYRIAKHWSEGDLTDFWQDAFYRPVVYGIDALALLAFGHHAYSIKIMHGIADLVSVSLIILIGRHLTGKVLPGIAAAALYAFTPYVITYCRAAMPHGLTAVFVLLALYLTVLGSRRWNSGRLGVAWDMLAGFSLGLAANTHADVALLGPGFLLIQSFEERYLRFHWRRVVGRAMAFGMGVILVYIAGFALFGPSRVVEIIRTEMAIGMQQEYIVQAPLYRVPYDILAIPSTVALGHRLWLPAFALTGFLCCLVLVARRRPGRLLYPAIPIVVLGSYLLLFPVTVGPFDSTHARLMIALLPVVALAISCPLYALMRQWIPAPGAAITFLAAAATALVWIPNEAIRTFYHHNPTYFVKSPFRALFDVMRDKVDAANKILIIPSDAYYNDGYQTELYFGKNAEFLADQKRDQPYSSDLFERIVLEKDFAYFYRPFFTDKRILSPTARYGWQSFPWIRHLGEPGYTADDEKRILDTAFAHLGVHPIAATPMGEIFSRRRRAIFPNSDFDAGTLEHWHCRANTPAFAVLEDKDSSTPLAPIIISTPQILRTPARIDVSPTGRGYYLQSTPATGTGLRETNSGEVFTTPFTIEHGVIATSISGKYNPESIHVALRVDGVEYRSVPKPDSGPTPVQWDVNKHIGKPAQLIVRDLDTAAGANIRVDGFYYVF